MNWLVFFDPELWNSEVATRNSPGGNLGRKCHMDSALVVANKELQVELSS